MHVYHYHPSTGEYLGTTLADESHLEPGDFLVPVHATIETPPPAPAGHRAVWADGYWKLVEDHRGREYWLADGSRHVIEVLGELVPEEALHQPPPLPPTAQDVIAERTRRLAGGFDYDFGDSRGIRHIGTTPADMAGWDEVSSFSAALLATGASGVKIAIVTDTGPAEITALEWQAILIAAAAFRQPIWAASFALQVLQPIPADYRDDKYWV